MKEKMIVIVMLLPMVLKSHAQGSAWEVKHKQQLEQWAEALNLTAEQRALIEDLDKKHREQIKPLLTDLEGNAEKLRALHREHRKEVKTVLTPEQQTRLKELRKEQKDKMKQMRSELRNYRESNIEPVLRKKRLEFNKELSEEERKTIDAMRKKVWKMREGAKEERRGHHHISRHNSHKKHHDMKQEMKVNLEPIVEAHKVAFDSIKLSLEAESGKWKADMKAIRAKYEATSDWNSDERRSGFEKHDKPETSHKKGAFRFLLMKPEKTKK
jgi:Spy/CpxP family protein refolding chaperone